MDGRVLIRWIIVLSSTFSLGKFCVDALKQIDQVQLEDDLIKRFDCLSEFMGFGDADVQSIHEVAFGLTTLDSK